MIIGSPLNRLSPVCKEITGRVELVVLENLLEIGKVPV